MHNQNPETLIDWFDSFSEDNEYDFLSNFYEGEPFRYNGHRFFTAEQAFAYMKVDPFHAHAQHYRWSILTAHDPGEAKSLGRNCPLVEDWDTNKFGIMREIVYAKFIQSPRLANKLLDTGQAWLQEGTYWNDRIWGVDITASENPFMRPGWNMLGSILMETRGKILAGQTLVEERDDCAY